MPALPPAPRVTRRGLLALGGGVTVAALLSGCQRGPARSTPSSSPGGSPRLDTATRSALDSAFAAAFAATGMAGVAAAVSVRDDLWESQAGVRDLVTQEPFDPDGTVRIASVTKTYTGTAVLQLVDERLLALHDTLDRWLPQIPNADAVTIRDLLAMSSGIADFTADPEFLARFDADPTMPWSFDDTLAVILRQQPSFAPGQGKQYCDSNFAILGHLVELTREAPLADVVTERIIRPLGLDRTAYPTSPALPDPHPTGYVPQAIDEETGRFDNEAAPPRVVTEVNPAVPAGAGAMVSTLADLRRWGDELVAGSLLAPRTRRLRTESSRFDGQSVDFGYGLGLTNLGPYYGHDGAIFGFSSVVLTEPRTGVQIALVGNESTNFTTPTLSIALALLGVIDPTNTPGRRG